MDNQRQTTSTLFTEILRPKTLDQCVLTKRVRTLLEAQVNSPKGLISNILLPGIQGTGKTTISRILAAGHDTKVINCSQTGIEAVRTDIETFASQLSLENGEQNIKVVLLEECDGFTESAWNAMRATVEKYSESVRFIANCNNLNKIPEPIKSRFTIIELYDPCNLDEAEELLQGYMQRVGLLFNQLQIKYTEESLRKFIEIYFPDFRSILNKVQEMQLSCIHELNINSLSGTFENKDLFEMIIKGNNPWTDYEQIRDNYGEYPDICLSSIGDSLPEYIRVNYPQLVNKIPLIIIATAEHQDMMQRAINKKITLASLIFKLQTILK